MNDFTPNRVQAGVPSGGQFAASARAEADVSLDDDFSPEERDEMISDALGHPVSDLSEDDRRLLNVLLDRDLHEGIGYDTDFESILENVSDWGSSDDWYGVTQVGEMLWSHHEREKNGDHSAPGSMDFTIHHQPESYDTPMYSVGYHLGNDVNSYLSMTSDGKYLSSRDTSGLRAALDTAGVIEGDYQRQRSKAIRLGLVPNPDSPAGEPDLATARAALADYDRNDGPDVDTMATMRDSLAAYVAKDAADRSAPKPSPWPRDDFERSVYADWQYEVANGDDTSGFRDWYTNRYPDGPGSAHTCNDVSPTSTSECPGCQAESD